MHIIYPRAICLPNITKETGKQEGRKQDCIILLSMLVLSVYILTHDSPVCSIIESPACELIQSRRGAPSLSTTRLSSPSSTTSGTKKQPTPHSAMRGTMIMKTARTPFILASASTSDASVPETMAFPLSGRADCVTAYCTAVLTANPVTAPSMRIRLRVPVATARSCGLQCA